MQNTTSPDKIFKLERAENPDTLTAVHAREKCCEDKNLSNGAVRLFCRLLDFALNPYVNLGKKGQVIVSQLKLATLINCAPRSIRNRTEELLTFDYVWLSKIPRPNTYPILCYHITAFQARKDTRLEMSADGLWGNCARRFGPQDGGSAARKKANDQNLPVASFLVDRFGKPISRISSVFPLPAATAAPCQQQPVAADSSNGSPLPAATAAGFSAGVAADSSNHSPLSAATAAPSPRQPVADLGETQPEVEQVLEPHFERSTGFNASKGGFGKNSAENRFLFEVGEMMERWKRGSAKAELQNSGGWWRMSYRADADLMRRVLSDTLLQVKEGKIFTTPGQAAVDLWKRWSRTPGN